MDTKRKKTHSDLFTLRIWAEELGDSRLEIRGQAKHVASGEIAYFRDWSYLQAFLTRHVQAEEAVDSLGEGVE